MNQLRVPEFHSTLLVNDPAGGGLILCVGFGEFLRHRPAVDPTATTTSFG